MIIDLPGTTTAEIGKRITEARERVGVVTTGRVLTLIIAPKTEAAIEESIAAANIAGQEHPSRVIVAVAGNTAAADARLDAQLRMFGDAGAGEVVVLRLSGPLAAHPAGVVVPFLLPDTPVVTWWPDVAPAVPADDPLGALAVRRITDATNAVDPLSAVRNRRPGYTDGDTDLAWSRVTYWRALLVSALDEPPFDPITSVRVAGLKTEPALDVLAGWLASRIDAPVRRAAGEPLVEFVRTTETLTLSRPQEGVTATLRRTGRPDAFLPLPRRDVCDCLAEDLRRLDPDELYRAALDGIDRVEYVETATDAREQRR